MNNEITVYVCETCEDTGTILNRSNLVEDCPECKPVQCQTCNDEGVVVEGSYGDEREVPCPDCHPYEEPYDTVEEMNGER